MTATEPEYIWYFAYGSNLKESRLRDRDVRVVDHKIGYIEDYTFRYNKIGVDNTGKGNIIDEEGSRVWGVFFKIPEEDYEHLHKAHEVGYRQIEVEGTSGESRVKAKSFVALPENMDDAMTPHPEYHNIVLKGAEEKKLPKEYIQFLGNIIDKTADSD